MIKSTIVAAIAVVVSLCLASSERLYGAEYLPGIQWAEPAIIDPGPPGGAPSDAVVLFNGTDMSKWNNAEEWIVKDGYVEAAKGAPTTKDVFGDCQVHVEWASADGGQRQQPRPQQQRRVPDGHLRGAGARFLRQQDVL